MMLFILLFLLLLSVPVIFFCVEVLIGLRFTGIDLDKLSAVQTRNVSCVVLIPAHNEASVIERTLSLLKNEVDPELDRILVVADNCVDDTANIARSLNCDVIERSNNDNRGKGYALEFAMQFLRDEAENPDVVLILDADCRFKLGSLERIKYAVHTTNSPVQCINRSVAPNGSGITQRISEFAVRVKNIIRNNGLTKLGFPAVLSGTGMAFPYLLLTRVKLGNAELAEDMKLGVDMTLAGYPPKFINTAEVISEFPVSGDALSTQRERWEHGHLGVMKSYLPSLFAKMIQQKNFHLLGSFLDLCIPPLSLLVLVTFVSTLIISIFGIFNAINFLVIYSLGLFFLLTSTVLTAWWQQGKDLLSIQDLLKLPIFILSKLGVYKKFVSGPQTLWVRTKRDGEDKSS